MKTITISVYKKSDDDSSGSTVSNITKEFDNYDEALDFLAEEATKTEPCIEAEKFSECLINAEDALEDLEVAFEDYAEIETDKEFVRDLCIRVNDVLDAYDELKEFLSEADR